VILPRIYYLEFVMKKEEYIDLYYQMVMIRVLEENASELYQQGKIGGFLHLYIGQEAVSTGLVAARLPQDRFITAYRDHGLAINCGLDPKNVIAELLGKSTGVSKGMGGSMHMADTEKNFWGGHAIVGAHIPIATGMALRDQYKGEDGITVCMFGDGASNIGYFHEGVNLSKVWNLPVLWVCENNEYGMGTTVERASAVTEIRQKAEGYGIPNKRIDGMDVLTVKKETEKAMKHIRDGKGPYFLEIMTYRYVGHSMGDPERYRKPEEIKIRKKKDPIKFFRDYLIENNKAIDKDLLEIETRVDEEIKIAIEFAEKSPEPAPEDLFKNIYVEVN
jgi:pyruvate dehydrogenase E1 component alpha subunit